MSSVAARSDHGPVSPNGVMAVMTASGAAACTALDVDRAAAAPRPATTARRPWSTPTRASSATSAAIVGIDGDAALAAGQPLEQRARLAVGDRPPRSRSTAAASDPRAARPASRRCRRPPGGGRSTPRPAWRSGRAPGPVRRRAIAPASITDTMSRDRARRGTRVA